MPRGKIGLILALAAATVGAWWHARRVAPVRAPGPVAWIAGAEERDAGSAEGDRVTALALSALSARDRDELRLGLDLLAKRIEIRKNPIAEDLEDDAPDEAVRAVRRSLTPTLTAAQALAARAHASRDGRFAVTLGASCDDAPAGATCFALWSEPPARATEDELRARFFAWPVTAAAVLRLPAPDVADVLDALRARARDPESRVSLALDERALAGAPDEGAQAVRDVARRVVESAGRAGGSAIDAIRPLAAEPPPGRRVPWLTLADGDILVVPKLGALSAIDAFVTEVQDTLRARGAIDRATWVRRPRAFE